MSFPRKRESNSRRRHGTSKTSRNPLTLTLREALDFSVQRRCTVSKQGTAGYTVGRVADLSGVTVRTLHHYDELGLLSPGGRSAAGYLIYEDRDLELLRRILFYRELGFTLAEISTIVDDPHTGALGHLRCQRGLLTERIERLNAMVEAIDFEMEARTMDIPLTPEERLEGFWGVPSGGLRRGGRAALGRDRSLQGVSAARLELHQGKLAKAQGRGGRDTRPPGRGTGCWPGTRESGGYVSSGGPPRVHQPLVLRVHL